MDPWLEPLRVPRCGFLLACIVIETLFASTATPTLGQEALRTSLAGEQASASRRDALENQTGSLQLGLASFQIGALMGLEWNDNVANSDANKQSDLIIRPGFGLASSVPLTEQNGLYFTLDLGYAKYIKYSQYDHLTISPGSQLTFDIYVKDFHFDFHDYLAVTEQPVAQGTLSGAGNYGQLSNLAGVGVDWDLNQVIASFGYDHQTVISTSSAFSYQDHSGDNLVLRASYEPSASWSGGPEASAGTANYDQPVLNNSKNYSLGAFLTWQPSTLSRLTLRAGYTSFSFEALPHQNPIPDTSDFYLDVNLSDRLNDLMDLSLSAGRQTRLGINSELIDFWYARPAIGWRLLEHVHLDTHFYFESGSDTGNPVYAVNESYTLLGGGIGAGYQLLEKLLVSLSYNYTVKNSDVAIRDYHQHKIQLQLQYTF